jgi:hypothetical protein
MLDFSRLLRCSNTILVKQKPCDGNLEAYPPAFIYALVTVVGHVLTKMEPHSEAISPCQIWRRSALEPIICQTYITSGMVRTIPPATTMAISGERLFKINQEDLRSRITTAVVASNRRPYYHRCRLSSITELHYAHQHNASNHRRLHLDASWSYRGPGNYICHQEYWVSQRFLRRHCHRQRLYWPRSRTRHLPTQQSQRPTPGSTRPHRWSNMDCTCRQ